jgi:hypothetical protein
MYDGARRVAPARLSCGRLQGRPVVPAAPLSLSTLLRLSPDDERVCNLLRRSPPTIYSSRMRELRARRSFPVRSCSQGQRAGARSLLVSPTPRSILALPPLAPCGGSRRSRSHACGTRRRRGRGGGMCSVRSRRPQIRPSRTLSAVGDPKKYVPRTFLGASIVSHHHSIHPVFLTAPLKPRRMCQLAYSAGLTGWYIARNEYIA